MAREEDSTDPRSVRTVLEKAKGAVTAVNLNNRRAAVTKVVETVVATAQFAVVAMSGGEPFPTADLHPLSCSIGAKPAEQEARTPRTAASRSDRSSASSSGGISCKPRLEIPPRHAPKATAGGGIEEPLTAE